MIDIWKVARILAVLVVACFVYVFWRHEERAIGARDVRIAQLQAHSDSQAVQVAADSVIVVKHDTTRIYRNVVRADTVLQRLIDTAIVHHHDTVWVTREVLVEAKASADSAKAAAQACCTLAHDWQRRWATTDTLYRLTLKQVASPAKPWIDRAEGFAFCALPVWLARK